MLSGIKVIDFSHWLAGPYCTNMLSDLGADVIKVEPLQGDQVRASGSYFKDGESYLFAVYNHGKRSIALNLKHPDGVKIAIDLCRDADVVVENFRPGTCEKLGIGYESIKEINPELIYCSISAFGDTKGYLHRPGMDPIVQGMGAVMSITGERNGPPLLVGVPIADISTAYIAFGAINAALFERTKTQKGQHIKLNLIDAMVFNLSTRFGQYIATENSPEPMGNAHAEVVPYQAFPTKDGWIMAGAQTDQAWVKFCQAIDRSDLANQPQYINNQLRLSNRDQLTGELNKVFETKTSDEWCEILNHYNILNGPVWRVEDLLRSDLVQDHQLIQYVNHSVFNELPVLKTPINFSDSLVEVQGPPPLLGEHTEEILLQLRYSRDAFLELVKNGVVFANRSLIDSEV